MIPKSASGTLNPSISDLAETTTLAVPERKSSRVCSRKPCGSSLCSITTGKPSSLK